MGVEAGGPRGGQAEGGEPGGGAGAAAGRVDDEAGREPLAAAEADAGDGTAVRAGEEAVRGDAGADADAVVAQDLAAQRPVDQLPSGDQQPRTGHLAEPVGRAEPQEVAG
ncbi:hypothetical protein [Streptomyces sp. CS62]|uniref:hypothetical protein n=1 Tax=Streptomyces sp. CS62 TaxID=3119268 RepID=UPI002F952A2F